MIKLNNDESVEKTEDLLKKINNDILFFNVSIITQQNLNKQIVLFLKNFTENATLASDITCNNLTIATNNIQKLNNNIEIINKLIAELNNIKENINIDSEELKTKITDYNSKFIETSNNIYTSTSEIEKYIFSLSTLDTTDTKLDTEPYKVTPIAEEVSSIFIEKTLVISEIKEKVILPFTIKEITNLYQSNPEEYTSLDDVVEKVFTRPISYYHPNAIARFKEAYNLMRNKEHRSIKESLSLAFEMLNNFNLHPAIISACQKSNELDIYLSCLEYNELADFKFFKIQYEVAPVIKKQKKLVSSC